MLERSHRDEQSAGLTTAPNLLVAGLGRCGTTMMMTMLDAGGFPVAGPRPSYELPEHGPGCGPTWTGSARRAAGEGAP